MRLISSVICDDIRNEINGKHTLVGVYGDTIKLGIAESAIPNLNVNIQMKLCFFLTLKKDQNDEIPDSFSIEFIRVGAQWPTVNGKFEKPDEFIKNKVLNMIIILPVIPIGGEGPIHPKLNLIKSEKILQSIPIEDFTIVIDRIK